MAALLVCLFVGSGKVQGGTHFFQTANVTPAFVPFGANFTLHVFLASKPLSNPYPGIGPIPTGTDMIMTQFGISKPVGINNSGFALIGIRDWTLQAMAPVFVNQSL